MSISSQAEEEDVALRQHKVQPKVVEIKFRTEKLKTYSIILGNLLRLFRQ